MTEIQSTKFKIKYHHRYDLRAWIRENFGFVENSLPEDYLPNHLNILEKRAGEILDACAQIEQIDIKTQSAYVKYYEKDWRDIKKACNERDFRKLGKNIEHLLIGMDYE